jgi:hypothetical protein
MVTNTASHVAHTGYGEENRPAIRAMAELKKPGTAVLSGRRLTKWFSTLSTALIVAAALAPNAFGIPTDLQPWVFLASIFWIFAFCAGIFDF